MYTITNTKIDPERTQLLDLRTNYNIRKVKPFLKDRVLTMEMSAELVKVMGQGHAQDGDKYSK